MPDAKEKISFTIVSVDPDRDTPEAILEYAQAFNPNFVGVSGAIDQIYTLATNLTLPFVPVLNSESTDYDMDHSMNLALISPEGKYFGFFKSPHNPENIAKALKSLITFAK
jgi:protein SCO1/2